MGFVFNPFTGNFDEVSVDVVQVGSPSILPNKRIEEIADGSSAGVLYFWVNGHRFKLTGTLADPVGGSTIGLLLALSTL